MNIKKVGTLVWVGLTTLFLFLFIFMKWESLETIMDAVVDIVSKLGAISFVSTITVYFIQKAYFSILSSKRHIAASVSITETLLDQMVRIEMDNAMKELRDAVPACEDMKKEIEDSTFSKEIRKRKYSDKVDDVSSAITNYIFALLRHDLTSSDIEKREIASNVFKKIKFVCEQPLVAKQRRDAIRKENDEKRKKKKREKLYDVIFRHS